MRATGAPVVCATVLRWAPSRVTRRGALTATAAAAAAAAAMFPSFFLSLSLLLAVHVSTDSVPFAVTRRPSWSRGARYHHGIPTMRPMVAWQPAFSSTKYTFAVPFTSKRRNGRSPPFFLPFSLPFSFPFSPFCFSLPPSLSFSLFRSVLSPCERFLSTSRSETSRSNQPRSSLRIVRSIRLFALIRTGPPGLLALFSFFFFF